MKEQPRRGREAKGQPRRDESSLASPLPSTVTRQQWSIHYIQMSVWCDKSPPFFFHPGRCMCKFLCISRSHVTGEMKSQKQWRNFPRVIDWILKHLQRIIWLPKAAARRRWPPVTQQRAKLSNKSHMTHVPTINIRNQRACGQRGRKEGSRRMA